MSWLLALVILTTQPKKAATAPSKAEEAAALRARATKLYRAKTYDQACPLFEQAAQLVPNDGPTLADWGLCLQRQGKLDEGLTVHGVHLLGWQLVGYGVQRWGRAVQ